MSSTHTYTEQLNKKYRGVAMINKLIRNVVIITGGDNSNVLRGDIGISGKNIAFVGKDDSFVADEIYDGKGMIAMPGLVNTHTHISMTLLRNYADDMRLHEWLFEKIFPAEDKLTGDDIYLGAQLGICESIRGGITTFNDMYYFENKVAEAAAETGINANICRCVMSQETDMAKIKADYRLGEALELYSNFSGYDDGRICVELGPHAVYTSSKEYLHHIANIAVDKAMRVHIHVSETKRENDECVAQTGVSPTAYLESLGYFATPTLAAHCVHLSEKDIDILASHRVSISHNPSSNLKLASGFAPIIDYIESGINVALGTDGASSNNNLDIFEEAHIAAITQKCLTNNPTTLPARQVLTMATQNGAKALGRSNTGILQKGYRADIILINSNTPNMLPLHNPESAVIYSANAADVDTVFCNGRLLMRGRELLTIDEEKVFHNVRKFK